MFSGISATVDGTESKEKAACGRLEQTQIYSNRRNCGGALPRCDLDLVRIVEVELAGVGASKAKAGSGRHCCHLRPICSRFADGGSGTWS